MREPNSLRYLTVDWLYVDLEDIAWLCLNAEGTKWPWALRLKSGMGASITAEMAIHIMNALKLYRGAP